MKHIITGLLLTLMSTVGLAGQCKLTAKHLAWGSDFYAQETRTNTLIQHNRRKPWLK